MGLLLGAAAPGCGYALVGRGTIVDPTIKRIGVPLFKDGTGRAGLDQRITRGVSEELLKRGRFDVVQSAAGVDALVETAAGIVSDALARRRAAVLLLRGVTLRISTRSSPLSTARLASVRRSALGRSRRGLAGC